jgi:ribosome biogenesis SPOUT family RNA methylase Rps3
VDKIRKGSEWISQEFQQVARKVGSGHLLKRTLEELALLLLEEIGRQLFLKQHGRYHGQDLKL